MLTLLEYNKHSQRYVDVCTNATIVETQSSIMHCSEPERNGGGKLLQNFLPELLW